MTRRLPENSGSAVAVAAVFAAAAAAIAGWTDEDMLFACLLGLAGWLLAARLTEGRLAPARPALLVPALALSVLSLAGLFVADLPSKLALERAAAPAVAGLVIGACASQASRERLGMSLAALLGILGACSLIRWASGTSSPDAVEVGGSLIRRIYLPGFDHPNHYAAALVMLLPFAITGAFAARRPAIRAFFILCSTTGVGALLLTFSRSAWIAFAVSAIVVCVLMARNTRARLAIGGVATALVLAMSPLIAGRFSQGDVGDNVRFEIWGRAAEVIHDHPVLGVGSGNFERHAGDVFLPLSAERPHHAHNLFLGAASELGLPAAGALIAVLGVLLVGLIRSRRVGRGDGAIVPVACLAAVTALVIAGLLDVMLYQPLTLILASIVLGLSASTVREATPGPVVALGPPLGQDAHLVTDRTAPSRPGSGFTAARKVPRQQTAATTRRTGTPFLADDRGRGGENLTAI